VYAQVQKTRWSGDHDNVSTHDVNRIFLWRRSIQYSVAKRARWNAKYVPRVALSGTIAVKYRCSNEAPCGKPQGIERNTGGSQFLSSIDTLGIERRRLCALHVYFDINLIV